MEETPGDPLVADIRAQIARGQLLAVVGSGVSVGATRNAPAASWQGLLHDGVARAESVDQARLPSGWRGWTRGQIDSGHLDSMLLAAESLTQALGGRSGGEYRRWLRESVGALTLLDRAVLDALVNLGVPLTTTNYDGLLEKAAGLRPVTWRDGALVQRVLRGDEPGIVHLHGYWAEPESVVLGVRSYEAVLGDAAAQGLQRAMASLRSLLFVGFGAGLEDPNFEALRAWLATAFPGSEYRHFRLCRDGEFDAVAAVHQREERILAVRYGTDHAALAPFLATLVSRDSLSENACVAESSQGRRAGPAQQPCAAPVAVPARTSNVPVPLDNIVGRGKEIDDIRNELQSSRLVTLTGPGGCGKTRLAVEVARARELRVEHEDRVYFVDLTRVSRAGSVLSEIARTLKVPEAPDVPVEDSLIVALGLQPILLVLDNCEHLLEEVADGAVRLLRGCANLRVLATSRERLRAEGEARYPVAPLPVPDPETNTRDEVLNADAVLYFRQQARKHMRSFEVTDHNAHDVALVCKRLDGLPLALQMAGARLAIMNLHDLVLGLGKQLDLLVDGERTGSKHHETMRATIDWSWRLLEPTQQTMFVDLAVFGGSFTLEAVREVCAGEEDSNASAISALAALVDASLVDRVVPEATVETRYRLLETVRAFAVEKLEEFGRARAVGDAHAAFFLDLVERAEPELRSGSRRHWMQRLGAERGNLQAAFTHLLRHGDPTRAGQLVGGLFWFWTFQGNFAQGRQSVEAVLAALPPEPATPSLAKALYCAGGLAFLQGDLPVAVDRLSSSVAGWQDIGEELHLALALVVLGHAQLLRGDLIAARGCEERALKIADRLGDSWVAALARMDLGIVLVEHGPAYTDAARRALDDACDLWRELDDRWGLPLALTYLGRLHCSAGASQEAKQAFLRALSIQVSEGDEWGRASTLRWLGEIAKHRLEHEQAVALFQESLELNQKLGRKQLIAECLEGLADVFEAVAMRDDAARLRGMVERVRTESGAQPLPADESKATAEARDRGRRMRLDEALAWARALRIPTAPQAPA